MGAWKASLDAWITAWNDFMNAGGITPCQDYDDAADEVDAFIDTMVSWYRDLLEDKLDMYQSSFDQLDSDIQTAYDECESAQDDLREQIHAQFDDRKVRWTSSARTPTPTKRAAAR